MAIKQALVLQSFWIRKPLKCKFLKNFMKKSDKILVVGINGSPHKKGTTVSVLNKFLRFAKKHGAEIQLINLVDYNIKHCLGCYSVDPKLCKYPCMQKDDFRKIAPLLLKADVLAFATPIYWFNMSGIMKDLIDRLCCMAAGGYLLDGKIGVFFACSKENEGGRATASLTMASALNHLGLFIPPYGILFYPGREEVVRNGKTIWYDWLSEDSEKIAKNVVELSKFLRKKKFNW